MPGGLSEYTSDKMSDRMPDRVSKYMSEYMPGRKSLGRDHSKKVCSFFPTCQVRSLDFNKGGTPSSSSCLLLLPTFPPSHFFSFALDVLFVQLVVTVCFNWCVPYRKLHMQWATPGTELYCIWQAPDAVGHAWTQTHAREHVRWNARLNAR